MGIKDKFSSARRKYFSLRHWMDIDGLTGNARKVGVLFKDLQSLHAKKKVDPKLTFDGWCYQHNITDADLAAYARKVFKFFLGYIVLDLLLLAYTIYLIVSGHYIMTIYLLVLTLSVALYAFKQYMVWGLLKMRKLKCSVGELVAWTFGSNK